MVGSWLVVLPLLVDLNTVKLQPIAEETNARRIRQLELRECCPCPGSERPGARFRADELDSTAPVRDECPCQNRANDVEASASILLPALTAIQPFVKQTDKKTEPKPLLQPEVGLASSVLETLREVTDEEYQDALARDAVRSAVKLIESDSSAIDDTLTETPKNIVQIFLNQNDDMEDNLPQPSHIQETRCIQSPLESKHNIGQLGISRSTPIIEMFDGPRKPMKTLKNNKNLLHKSLHDMDSSVGASNIQERITQPNTDDTLQNMDLTQIQTDKPYPSLFDLLSPNNKEKSDDFQESSVKTFNVDSTVKPKTSVKLRDFLDNLESLKKEKNKLPVLDLKQYFATSTRLPPLKLKPLENPFFRNSKPLQLKDLLKLKDVELISRNNVAKSADKTENSLSNDPNLKLQSINCDDHDNNNFASINRDITTIRTPTNFESVNAGIIDTESNTAFDSNDSNALQNSNNNEDLNSDASININKKPDVTTPADFLTENNSDIDSTESQEGLDTGDSLIENDIIKRNISSTECMSPNTEIIKHELNNNVLKNGLKDNINSNMDTSSEESTNNEYQIEYVEDTSLPIEFDNSSFVAEKDVNDSKSTKSTNEKLTMQEILDDSIAETSVNNLHIIKQDDEIPTTSELLFKNTIDNSIPNDNFSQICKNSPKEGNDILANNSGEANTFITRNLEELQQPNDLRIGKETQEKNKLKERTSEDISNMPSTNNRIKDDSSQINMQDLQVMSDSILNLSECGTFNNEDSYEESNIKEDFNEIQTDDVEISNPEFAPSSINILKGELKEDENFVENSKATLDSGFNQDSCISPTPDDSMDNMNAVSNSIEMLDATDNEMLTEASEPKTNSVTFTNFNLVEPKTSSLRNAIDDSANNDVVTKIATGPNINDILQINKHSEFFDGLKSKLGNLLRTTERVPKNNVLNNLEDSVNESSNKMPTITLTDEFNILDRLQYKPQKLLQETLPQFPGLLNSYKRKLPVPKSLDNTITLRPALTSHIDTLSTPKVRKDNQEAEKYKDLRLNKSLALKKTSLSADPNNLRPTSRSTVPNLLKSPLDFSRPFEDVLDPHSALAVLSDRLRSHTEDTIQTLKDTLESRLKESQSSGLHLNSNTIGSPDILESITSRRDELNDKLHAIHSDINDRFSNIQRSIVDQLNLPTSGTYSEYGADSSSRGLTLNPLQSTLSGKSRPRTTNSKQEPQVRFSHKLNIPEENKTTEGLFKSSIPKTISRLKINKPFISQNKDDKQPEKNHLPSFKYKLPKVTIDDTKISYKPILFTTTEKPSLLPRQKSFKSRVAPKVHIEAEEKITKDKPMLRKPAHKNIISVEPETSPSHDSPFSNSRLEKNIEINRDDTSDKDSDSTDSPLDKLRKTLLRRNQDMKSRNNLKTTSNKIKIQSNLLQTEDDDESNTVLSRVREGRTRLKSQTTNDALTRNDKHKLRPNPDIDTEHAAAQKVEQVKLVEPLKENVPYKCKLICYKDV